jgi:hypothetical protein
MSHPAESDLMKQILQQLSAMNAALTNQEARHQAEMEAIRHDLEAVKTNSRSLSPPPQATPPSPTQTTSLSSQPRSERLPDPPMFTGKRKDLPLFLTKLRFKLRGNADRYPNEESKLIYAHSRLEHDPATLVDPLLNSDIATAEDLMLFLQATYGDPNRELSAWSKLDNLKQGKKKTFLSHFAEFRRLIADTGLNEAAQISQLRRSLSDDLRHAMVGVKIPQDLNEYANLISLYDNDLRHLPDRKSHHYYTQRRDPEAMEIDVANYAPLGSTERQKRIKDGSCFKCGKKGHISRDCSAPLPQIRNRSSSPKTSTVLTSRTRHQRQRSTTSTTSTLSTPSQNSRSPRGRRSPDLSHERKVKTLSRG